MRKLLIAVLLLAFVSSVEAARRWFVQTSDNKIISFTDDDNAPTPAGTIAVADAVIRTEDPPGATGEITPLGTWDGSTYTAPSGGGIVEHFDPTTDSGAVKSSCDAMLDVFDVALAFIRDNQLVWPDAARIAIAIEGIRWQIINSARVALNATRTAARRQKFCEESASWPDGTDGHVGGYLDAISANDSLTTPTKDWSWVDPQADPYTRPTVANSTMQFGSATNVENAPSSEKLIGRDWINDIP